MNTKKIEQRINVTKPTLPDFSAYTDLLADIWETQWLTNNGKYAQALETRLAEYLSVPHVSAMANGTLALIIALRAVCEPPGKIITTPFTFPATAHAVQWLGFTPVFADIDPQTGNIDPTRVSELIDADTRAILAVHVYGNPCDHKHLSQLCDQAQIPLVYDAAHAFGVSVDGESILSWGDASAISFHATKLFSTIEGGAVTTQNPAVRKRAELLRNFGITDEETVAEPGINAKMSEVHAAFGLLRLDGTDHEIASRAEIAQIYDEAFADLPGLVTLLADYNGTKNYSYYPVRIVASVYGLSRDQSYPVCSEFRH